MFMHNGQLVVIDIIHVSCTCVLGKDIFCYIAEFCMYNGDFVTTEIVPMVTQATKWQRSTHTALLLFKTSVKRKRGIWTLAKGFFVGRFARWKSVNFLTFGYWQSAGTWYKIYYPSKSCPDEALILYIDWCYSRNLKKCIWYISIYLKIKRSQWNEIIYIHRKWVVCCLRTLLKAIIKIWWTKQLVTWSNIQIVYFCVPVRCKFLPLKDTSFVLFSISTQAFPVSCSSYQLLLHKLESFDTTAYPKRKNQLSAPISSEVPGFKDKTKPILKTFTAENVYGLKNKDNTRMVCLRWTQCIDSVLCTQTNWPKVGVNLTW